MKRSPWPAQKKTPMRIDVKCCHLTRLATIVHPWRVAAKSGGHGIRTRNPFRDTSFPVRPLANSLTLRRTITTSATEDTEEVFLLTCSRTPPLILSNDKWVISVFSAAEVVKNPGRPSCSRRGAQPATLTLAPLIRSMNSWFVLNFSSLLTSCSIASTWCIVESVRRSMVTA